jgi:hypothetical protein
VPKIDASEIRTDQLAEQISAKRQLLGKRRRDDDAAAA